MQERRTAYAFVAPAFVMLVVILGFPPSRRSCKASTWRGSPSPGFSLASYRMLLTDAQFHVSLYNTVCFVAATVSFHLAMGLAVALLLNAEVRGKWLFRVVALLPWTIPDVIGGIVWRFMFDTLRGIVNAILLRVGTVAEPIDWLGSPRLAFLSLVLAEGWRGYPFIMLILLAGLQAIPRHLCEAAQIDGASAWQGFRYITVPGLRTMFIIALVLDTIWQCRLFGMVYGMTGGGPGNATQVISVLTTRPISSSSTIPTPPRSRWRWPP
jgi:multiple sugar transport system permease protein